MQIKAKIIRKLTYTIKFIIVGNQDIVIIYTSYVTYHSSVV